MEELVYTLIRKRTNRMNIKISMLGGVTVTCPRSTPKTEIDKFLDSMETWIKNGLKKVEVFSNNLSSIGSNPNQYLMYLGTKYLVSKKEEISTPYIKDSIFYLPASYTLLDIKKYFKEETLKFITPLLDEYAAKMGVTYNKVSISKAKTYVGTCSYNNDLSFNYHLIMFPLEIIKYTIVHELAHTVHHNHSSSFWQLVKSNSPDYKTTMKYLKEYTYLLYTL